MNIPKSNFRTSFFIKNATEPLVFLPFSVVFALFFWQNLITDTFDISLATGAPIILGASIWLAYVGDRLLDALFLRKMNLPKRPQEELFTQKPQLAFYQNYFTPILLINLALLVFTVVFSYRMLPLPLFLRGVGLLSLALIYQKFLARKQFPMIKLLATALLLVLGLSLFVDPVPALDSKLITAGVCLFLLFTLNLMVIQAKEVGVDQIQKLRTSASSKNHNTFIIIALLTILLLSARLPQAFSNPIIFSSLLLTALNYLRTRFSLTITTLLADLALLSPLVSNVL